MKAVTVTSIWPFILLAIALLIALGFEFVNGFHDTANAVATVIYTDDGRPLVRAVAALVGLPRRLPAADTLRTYARRRPSLLRNDLTVQEMKHGRRRRGTRSAAERLQGGGRQLDHSHPR